MDTNPSGSQRGDYTITIEEGCQTSRQISREELYRDLAFSLSKRGSCERLQVGAILTRNRRLVGAGYNGSPPGCKHCTDVGCLIVSGRCIRTIHAEVNALLSTNPDTQSDSDHYILWVTHRPCLECVKVSIAAGVKNIVYWIEYESDAEGFNLFMEENPDVISIRKAPTTQAP